MTVRWVVLLLVAGAALAQGPAGPDPNASTVWVNRPKPGSLPAGVTHHTYRSESMGREVGYLIYLPPEYQQEPQRRYPVIYNLHGAGGNELHGQLAAEILHEGILAKRWPPMILVMPNGGKYTYYKDSADGRYRGETTIIRELIPHIDQTYRTIAAREGRAIEGFSMGGRGATRLAMKYPDLFCSLFNQAGNVYHTSAQYDPAKPDQYPNNYLGKDRRLYVENDAFLLLRANVEKIRGRMRIQIACGTKDDGHLKKVREFHQALLDADVDHTYIEIEGLAHEQSKMLQLYRPVWFDYHAESFRRAAKGIGKY
jgi:S-formylglutathione hydrolase FrmB